eukprot:1054319-Pleurochrysis_carterae.AAC.1
MKCQVISQTIHAVWNLGEPVSTKKATAVQRAVQLTYSASRLARNQESAGSSRSIFQGVDRLRRFGNMRLLKLQRRYLAKNLHVPADVRLHSGYGDDVKACALRVPKGAKCPAPRDARCHARTHVAATSAADTVANTDSGVPNTDSRVPNTDSRMPNTDSLVANTDSLVPSTDF